jgi:hypothetical protein
MLSQVIIGNDTFTIPISTMPDETFEKILLRSNLSPEEKALAEEYRNNNAADFINSLKKYRVTDLIAIPDENDLGLSVSHFWNAKMDTCLKAVHCHRAVDFTYPLVRNRFNNIFLIFLLTNK